MTKDLNIIKRGLAHEYAHAALAIYFHFDVDEVYLRDDGSGVMDGKAGWWGKASRHEEVLITCAGYVGECLWRGDTPTLEEFKNSDSCRKDYSSVQFYYGLDKILIEVYNILKQSI